MIITQDFIEALSTWNLGGILNWASTMTASGNTETSAGEFKQIDGCALRCCSPKMLITTTLCLAYLGLVCFSKLHLNELMGIFTAYFWLYM